MMLVWTTITSTVQIISEDLKKVKVQTHFMTAIKRRVSSYLLLLIQVTTMLLSVLMQQYRTFPPKNAAIVPCCPRTQAEWQPLYYFESTASVVVFYTHLSCWRATLGTFGCFPLQASIGFHPLLCNLKILVQLMSTKPPMSKLFPPVKTVRHSREPKESMHRTHFVLVLSIKTFQINTWLNCITMQQQYITL